MSDPSRPLLEKIKTFALHNLPAGSIPIQDQHIIMSLTKEDCFDLQRDRISRAEIVGRDFAAYSYYIKLSLGYGIR